MAITELTREQLIDHATRCAACGACDTDLLTALEVSPDEEVAEHVRLSHDRTWRSILRRRLRLMSKPCPTCGGTGNTWGLTCRTCDGDGNIPATPRTP